MRYLSLLFLLLLLNGCGSSEEAVTEELNENTITLSPEPGTFTHGVIVTFTKKDDGAGSGALYFKVGDEDWSLSLASCLGGVDSSNTCVEVNETTTIQYKLTTTAGDSDVQTATYTIEPEVNNYTVNSTEITEDLTECSVDSDGKLEFRARGTTSTLTSKYVYLFGQIADVTKLNTDFAITDGSDAGVATESNGSDAPYSPDYYPGASSSSTGDSCTVALTAFTAGQLATGTIECSTSINQFSTPQDFGTTMTLTKSNWKCDKWVSFL
ncbi:MAG: hypothetical protein AB8G05_27540 [Oligoflexales bacterium]